MYIYVYIITPQEYIECDHNPFNSLLDGAGVGLSDACILVPLIVIVTIPLMHLFFYFFQSEESAKTAAIEQYNYRTHKVVDEFKKMEQQTANTNEDYEKSANFGRFIKQKSIPKIVTPTETAYQVQPFEDF